MNRFDCLIVDDEDTVIDRLTRLFQSPAMAELPYRLAGAAYSGLEGVELALRLKPDIVVTDIVMPGMDGLNMIETLQDQLPGTVFIILSAYSDFHYAKKALNLNVLDYVMKVPLNEADLLTSLEQAARTIHTAAEREKQWRQLNVSLLENKYRIRKQVFYELLNGQIQGKQMKEFLGQWHLTFTPDNYCCIMAGIDRPDVFRSEWSASDQRLMLYGLLNITEEIVQQFGDGFAFEWEGHRVVGYLSVPPASGMAALDKLLRELGSALIRSVKQYLKLSVSVSCSGAHHGWESMTQAYSQASGMQQDLLYREEASVITSLTPVAYQEQNKEPAEALIRAFVDSLRPDSTMEQSDEDLSMLLNRLQYLSLPPKLLTSLLMQGIGQVRIRLLSWKQDLPEWEEADLQRMRFADLAEKLRRYLAQCLRSGSLQTRAEIVKALHFIEANLTERLSLNDVAKHVNLTPAYFSTLFKREMREGFVDCLNRKRIDKAIELMKEREYTNLELSERTGLYNEGYFCTLFKKTTGYSPRQFRKRMYRNER